MTDDFDIAMEKAELAMAHRTDSARDRAAQQLRDLRRLKAEGIDLGYADEARLARLEAGQ